MMIRKTQIFFVAIMFSRAHVSECAQVDLFRPDNSKVLDLSKINSPRDGKHAEHAGAHWRNRGRLRVRKQEEKFELKHDLVVVPGMNGMIGDSAETFVYWLKKKYNVVRETPKADLGQANCMQDLRKVIQEKVNNEKVIEEKINNENDKKGYVLFGTSQGTATSVNFFNTITQGEKVAMQSPKALILQACMLSGNNAIYHTATQMVLPFLAYLPGSYYWLPYFAKVGLWSYLPAGDQPVYNVEKIPTDLPVIILHCAHDRQLSFQDAQGLYAALRRNGNENVYLFKVPSSDDIVYHFVGFSPQIKREILAILKKHEVIKGADDLPTDLKTKLPNSIDIDDLQLRQPQVKQKWLNHFDAVLKKEKRMFYVDAFVKVALISLITYVLYAKGIAGKILDKISFNIT